MSFKKTATLILICSVFETNIYFYSDEGKITQRLASGRIVTKFPNGTVKEISANGDTTVLRYQNGDVQQTLPDGKVKIIIFL